MADDPEKSPRFRYVVPDGDTRPRFVCEDCGFIQYQNPKVVVGLVATWEDRLLMCRRAIEPRRGFWTIPAGYLETKETCEAGALREAKEEANAHAEIDGLLAVYDISHISQVQLIYHGRLTSQDVSPGIESLEVALLAWGEIPWQDLAFPSVQWALEQFCKIQGTTGFPPFGNPNCYS